MVGTLYSSVITRNVGRFVTFALLNIVQDVFNGCVEEGVILMQELVGIAWCVIFRSLSRKVFYCTAMTKCLHDGNNI